MCLSFYFSSSFVFASFVCMLCCPLYLFIFLFCLFQLSIVIVPVFFSAQFFLELLFMILNIEIESNRAKEINAFLTLRRAMLALFSNFLSPSNCLTITYNFSHTLTITLFVADVVVVV